MLDDLTGQQQILQNYLDIQTDAARKQMLRKQDGTSPLAHLMRAFEKVGLSLSERGFTADDIVRKLKHGDFDDLVKLADDSASCTLKKFEKAVEGSVNAKEEAKTLLFECQQSRKSAQKTYKEIKNLAKKVNVDADAIIKRNLKRAERPFDPKDPLPSSSMDTYNQPETYPLSQVLQNQFMPEIYDLNSYGSLL